ncbi:hypothetical protein [Methylotenera sp.]|uniref:hypothetical protein n=1 Tax=Methylotenera sp. TaxID=2051956 RepID=UPI00248A6DE2|nr:hypothetical protein [Methylotenera sp.]MDI1298628.1 hypothetical protein [Methylotenera sp.]
MRKLISLTALLISTSNVFAEPPLTPIIVATIKPTSMASAPNFDTPKGKRLAILNAERDEIIHQLDLAKGALPKTTTNKDRLSSVITTLETNLTLINEEIGRANKQVPSFINIPKQNTPPQKVASRTEPQATVNPTASNTTVRVKHQDWDVFKNFETEEISNEDPNQQ